MFDDDDDEEDGDHDVDVIWNYEDDDDDYDNDDDDDDDDVKSGNPPTPSMHVSSQTMPNFRPSRHIYTKIQCWPHVAH